MAARITTAAGNTWQEIAADRQAHRDATLAAVEPPLPTLPTDLPLNVIGLAKEYLTPEEITITESLVEELVPALAAGKFSAVTVAKAFLRRAALAAKLTNCITELLPSPALARAAELDAYLAEHGKPIGPLHGIPISVKEHITMKGLDINAGFVSWVGKVGEEDALILQILRDAGAVFYARTTEPQTLMHLETSTNIYGVTVNPFNRTLTAGGSSGGEGALIGFRGSCLGIGTDIGGSIRSPAANQGLYGFKPSALRLPVSGWSATMGGAEHILGTIGPLCTSLAGAKLFVKTLIEGKPWLREPSLLPMEWKETTGLEGRPLVVGVLWDDGVVHPHPPITRALREVVEKLKASPNVKVVEWSPYKHAEAWEIIANLYFADGGVEESAAIDASKEPWRPLSTHILKDNKHCVKHDIPSLWKSTERREDYRLEYAQHWNNTDVDVILCPVGPSAAPKLDTAKYWGYTSQWNILDYPAVVFPVSKVDETLDAAEEAYEPKDERDAENWRQWTEEGAKGYKDAPISLQIVSRRYYDEVALKALEIVKEETGLPFVKYL